MKEIIAFKRETASVLAAAALHRAFERHSILVPVETQNGYLELLAQVAKSRKTLGTQIGTHRVHLLFLDPIPMEKELINFFNEEVKGTLNFFGSVDRQKFYQNYFAEGRAAERGDIYDDLFDIATTSNEVSPSLIWEDCVESYLRQLDVKLDDGMLNLAGACDVWTHDGDFDAIADDVRRVIDSRATTMEMVLEAIESLAKSEAITFA